MFEIKGSAIKNQDVYRYMLEGLDDHAILLLDEKGNVINCNKGLEKFLGHKAEDIKGKNYKLLFTPEDCEKEIPEKLMERAVVYHKSKKDNLEIKKSGRSFFCSVVITAIYSGKNKVIGFSMVINDITEKIGIKEKLSPGGKRFRHTLDNMLEGAQILDFTWRYIYVNNALTEYSKYSKEELLGYSIIEKYPGIENTELFKVMERCMYEGIAENFENEFTFPDGSIGYFDLSIQPVPEGIFILSIDITKRKVAEKKLEESFIKIKESLFKIFNSSPSGMIIIDTESGKLIEINKSFLEVFGYDHKEMIGLTVDELLITPSDSQQTSFTKLKKQRQLKNEEILCYTKEGRRRDAIFSAELIEMEGKEFFLCVFHDITEMKAMERKIIESENKYRNIIEEAGDVLCTTNSRGVLTYINKQADVLTEYSNTELIGKHFSRLIADEWKETVISVYQSQFDNGIREMSLEFVICTRTGKKRWVEQIVIIQQEEGIIKGFQSIVRDIDERKKADLLLKEQKQIIEQKNKNIIDSINYAKRIQDAIFPPEELIKKMLPKSFVLYKPKDIVSGDFYWVEKFNNKTYLAAADCAGHGVPGALLSIVGYNLLSKSINEHGHTKPNEILNELSNGINKTLRQTLGSFGIRDTMDIALCSIDTVESVLEFAGAYNSLYLIRKDKLIEISADRFPIGRSIDKELKKFTNHKMKLIQGDTLYLFSDGYPDQFGGPKGKKFRYKRFRELFLSMQHLPMNEQKELLDKTIENWKNTSEEQTDDILIIGVRVEC